MKLTTFTDRARRLWPLPSDDGNRCLILWWGSLRRTGATAGDIMAAANMALGLQKRGIAVEIAAYHDLQIPGIKIVHPATAQPSRYKAVCFVCGPLRASRKILELLDRYDSCKRAAVGVGVLEEERDVLTRFDIVVARDGQSDSTFDLALADPWRNSFPQRAKDPKSVSTCFRGKQGPVGKSRYALTEQAEEVLQNAADIVASGENVRAIDTVTRTPKGLNDILALFSQARLVLTTRLHGSLLSLEQEVPFIAVDQINGGHKVTEVLGKIGWPFVFRAETVKLDHVVSGINTVTDATFSLELKKYRARAISESNSALKRACDEIEHFY